MNKPDLITEEYRRMQSELHRNAAYGMASVEYAPLVAQVMRAKGIYEFLDYGAGKGRLGATLEDMFDEPLTIHHYDPAIPEWSDPPEPCKLVACIDVLEHIEPALLDNVLDDLKRVTAGTGVFTVHIGPAVKTLPDGRNAHLIQEPMEWWLAKFEQRFNVTNVVPLKYGFCIVVERKDGSAA